MVTRAWKVVYTSVTGCRRSNTLQTPQPAKDPLSPSDFLAAKKANTPAPLPDVSEAEQAPFEPASLPAPAWETNTVAAATALLFLGLALILAAPLFSHASWLIFVQDDLLYYLKVAQNVVHGHGSTFNGIVPTNGYQPLWFYLLVLLSRFTENSRIIMACLAVTNFVAALVTFLLTRRLLRRSGARPLTVFALAAWVTLYSVTLFFYGMEVTLTVPILLGVISLLLDLNWLQRSFGHAFLFGLLLSAMALSRIDTLIFGALVLLGILLTPALRRLLRPALLAGTALGLIPLLAYFLSNHLLFQTWMPVSGMAKQLKFGHGPSLEPWRVFFHPLAGSFTLVLLCALCLLPAIRSRLSPMARVLFPAVILFPFLYYFILSCVSDWTLWGWYIYPIRTALCISFLIFCLWPPSARLLNKTAIAGLLALTVFLALTKLRWTRQQTDIYAATLEIQDFARTHPGTYAMGDRAGRVAYLIPDPIIQTEGLMMDRPYLDFIRRQTPLRETLAHYNVRYYIGTAYEPFTGCFHANEPAKAGPTSAHIRADFCNPPEATFLHDGVETLIFDLQKPQ